MKPQKRHHKKPVPFYQHIARNTTLGLILTASALYLGMLGYHLTEHMSWVDSFMNASMILSGMGPAATMQTTAGKLFSGFYALFSGLAFIAIIVIILSPAIHQFFRKIHLEDQNSGNED